LSLDEIIIKMEDDRVADLNNEDVLLAARYGDLDDLKQWLDGSQPQLVCVRVPVWFRTD